MARILPRWITRPSLRACVVGIVLVVVLPTLGVVAMALAQAGQSYRDAATQRLLETAQVIAQSASSDVNSTIALVDGLAHANEQTSGQRMQTSSVRFPANDMQVYHAYPATDFPKDMPDSTAIKSMIDIAMTGRQRIVSNIVTHEDLDNGEPRIIGIVPHYTEGRPTDVSVMVIPPEGIIRSIHNETLATGTAVIAITDGHGRIMGRSIDGDALVGKPVPDWDTLAAMNSNNGSFRARTIEGNEVVLAFQRIPDTPGWVAVVAEDAGVFDGRSRRPIYAMLMISSVTVLCALALALFLVNVMLKPVTNLANRARAVAASGGEVDDRTVPLVRRSFIGEIEELRRSLRTSEAVMRDSLLESRRSEARTRESHAALEQAEELARIGSWRLDLETGKFTSSRMMYELNGADPNGPDLTIDDLAELMRPDDLERVKASIQKCAETGEPYGFEVMHLRKNAPSFMAYLRGQPLRNEHGRIVAITGTVQDITESTEAREQLKALADNLPNGALYRLGRDVDGVTRILYVSAGIERLIGYPPEAIEADTNLYTRAIFPEDRARVLNDILRSAETVDVLDTEYRLIHRDGSLVWLHSRAAPRRTLDGRIIWDGIIRDITADREIADDLRAAKEAAEAADRAKADFLATMSHEIRTPMNTVIGMSRLALQTNLDVRQRNYLDKINASASVLLGIINDILDFSKIEAGGLKLEGAPFSLESILDSVSAVTSLKADEKNLEIVYSVRPDTPAVIKGDSLRLGQVLTNLVSNAVKFTEKGDIRISIAPVGKPARDGSTVLKFAVRDTGVGMTRDQTKMLFRPFSQAEDATSRKYGGTGLGLAISKRLVEMMDGKISVQSRPGKGSTFTFTARFDPVGHDEVPTGLPLLSGPKLEALNERRILIVDDNEGARLALAEMVTAFGMVTHLAASGEEALAAMDEQARRGQPFDIVLLDWRMPGMDGLETARRIKADAKLYQMPAVLMVTAYRQVTMMEAIERTGIQSVLLKPVTQSVMFNTVAEALSNKAGDTPTVQPLAASDTAADIREFRNLLSGKRVLVVDDNAFNREVASDFLSLVDVSVETAVDGADALQKMRDLPFDAVLMDVHMPNMSGLEAVREIRKRKAWERLPVIALTAQARVEDHHASMTAGMTAHLTKPIDELALYRTLVRTLSLGTEIGAPPERAASPVPVRNDRLIAGFLRDFHDAPQRLDIMLADDRMDQIAELAHQLKGSIGYLGAHEMTEPADMLERAARKGNVSAVNRMLPGFRQRLAGFLNLLQDRPAVVPSGPTGQEMPPDEVLAMIDEIAPILDQGDFAAVALMERMEPGLADADEQRLVQTLMEAFEDLNLEMANELLKRLRMMVEGRRTRG